MFQLTALFHHPDDAAAFDEHYDGTHGPLAAKIPGLQRYTVVRPGPDSRGNPPAYHLVAILEWEDEAAFGAGMRSPEGKATSADLANFTAGFTMLTGSATHLTPALPRAPAPRPSAPGRVSGKPLSGTTRHERGFPDTRKLRSPTNWTAPTAPCRREDDHSTAGSVAGRLSAGVATVKQLVGPRTPRTHHVPALSRGRPVAADTARRRAALHGQADPRPTRPRGAAPLWAACADHRPGSVPASRLAARAQPSRRRRRRSS